MLISVIVPVYNTGKYLKKCVDSILNQTIGFNNIELIIVNDGSYDDSDSIIKDIINKNSKIKYFSKENGGQGSARNLGLKHATGEYISFVDSDDWIDTKMYEDLYNIAIKENIDIITCNYTKVYDNYSEEISFRYIEDEHKNFIIMNTGPCNMLIKRSLLKKINFKFPEKIIYEDLAVIPSLAFYDVNIKLVEKSYYNYYIRSGSSMNKKKYNQKLNDIFISINNLYDIWCKIDKERKYYSEIEFIFIRRLLMSASLRFIEFNDPDNSINKISDVIKEKFPNWEKNKYYNKLNFKQKIVGIFTYKKMKKMLYLCYNVNRKFGGRNG